MSDPVFLLFQRYCRLRAAVFFILCVSLAGCSGTPVNGSGEDGFYSYVDAQGNLVTIAAPPAPDDEVSDAEPRMQVDAEVEPALQDKSVPSSQSAGAGHGDASGYVDSEALIEEMAARDRQRFISYPGVDGQLVTETLDKQEMEAAREAVDPGYRELEAAGFIETPFSVAADCCLAVIEQAPVLRVDREVRLAFDRQIQLGQSLPASVFRIGDGVGELSVATFLRNSGYQHPAALFLREDGVPVLHVDNIFQRKYAETWYRYAMLSGKIAVEPEFHYVIFYLGYVDTDDVPLSPAIAPSDAAVDADSPLARRGEAVVRARQAVESGGTEAP